MKLTLNSRICSALVSYGNHLIYIQFKRGAAWEKSPRDIKFNDHVQGPTNFMAPPITFINTVVNLIRNLKQDEEQQPLGAVDGPRFLLNGRRAFSSSSTKLHTAHHRRGGSDGPPHFHTLDQYVLALFGQLGCNEHEKSRDLSLCIN